MLVIIERHIVPVSLPIVYGSQAAIKEKQAEKLKIELEFVFVHQQKKKINISENMLNIIKKQELIKYFYMIIMN